MLEVLEMLEVLVKAEGSFRGTMTNLLIEGLEGDSIAFI